MSQMELPYYALHLIKQFSQPLTRPDWMTCKMREADLIHEVVQMCRETHKQRLTMWAHVDPFRLKVYRSTMEEINEWTHYGRAKILKQPLGWTIHMPQGGPDETNYLAQFAWLVRRRTL